MKDYKFVSCYQVASVEWGDILARTVEDMELEPIKDGAGHPGTGYKSGWIQGLANTRIPYDQVSQTKGLGPVLTVLMDALPEWHVRQIMVNRMAPHSYLAPHRDGPNNGYYRFHLPVITNPYVLWWDELIGADIHMEPGYWHGPVPYAGVLHSVCNDGDVPRFHVIVDMEAPK